MSTRRLIDYIHYLGGALPPGTPLNKAFLVAMALATASTASAAGCNKVAANVGVGRGIPNPPWTPAMQPILNMGRGGVIPLAAGIPGAAPFAGAPAAAAIAGGIPIIAAGAPATVPGVQPASGWNPPAVDANVLGVPAGQTREFTMKSGAMPNYERIESLFTPPNNANLRPLLLLPWAGLPASPTTLFLPGGVGFPNIPPLQNNQLPTSGARKLQGKTSGKFWHLREEYREMWQTNSATGESTGPGYRANADCFVSPQIADMQMITTGQIIRAGSYYDRSVWYTRCLWINDQADPNTCNEGIVYALAKASNEDLRLIDNLLEMADRAHVWSQMRLDQLANVNLPPPAPATPYISANLRRRFYSPIALPEIAWVCSSAPLLSARKTFKRIWSYVSGTTAFIAFRGQYTPLEQFIRKNGANLGRKGHFIGWVYHYVVLSVIREIATGDWSYGDIYQFPIITIDSLWVTPNIADPDVLNIVVMPILHRTVDQATALNGGNRTIDQWAIAAIWPSLRSSMDRAFNAAGVVA